MRSLMEVACGHASDSPRLRRGEPPAVPSGWSRSGTEHVVEGFGWLALYCTWVLLLVGSLYAALCWVTAGAHSSLVPVDATNT